MMTLLEKNKQALRIAIQEKVWAISDAEKKKRSMEIMSRLSQTREFLLANSVLLYWSLSDEVYTHHLLNEYRYQKKMLLPVVSGSELVIKQFQGDENLSKNRLGTYEPLGAEVAIEEIDLAIVPGIGFDKKGGRMGRGKGFYDRLLSQKKFKTVGLCFSEQIVEDIPRNERDVLLDHVIYG